VCKKHHPHGFQAESTTDHSFLLYHYSGLRFSEVDLDAECHIDVDVQWMANIAGSSVPGAPLIGDFRNDGKKELAIVTGDEYIEVIEAEDGRKESGWPFYVPEKRFVCSAIDYDLSGKSKRDILVTTLTGELFFLTYESMILFFGLEIFMECNFIALCLVKKVILIMEPH
jgi:hypothetical protein